MNSSKEAVSTVVQTPSNSHEESSYSIRIRSRAHQIGGHISKIEDFGRRLRKFTGHPRRFSRHCGCSYSRL